MNHQEMFGSAKWIGCAVDTATPYIRADFNACSCAKAEITICGLGYFELYINGHRISGDLFVPVTSDYVKRSILLASGQPFDEEMGHRCYVCRYDITDYLQEGKNGLAVALGPGFFASPVFGFDEDEANVRFGDVRLCYCIEMSNMLGEKQYAVSGEDARWLPGIVTEHNFFCGEKQDLRLHEDDWCVAPTENWKPVRVLENMETEYQLQDCPPDRIIRTIEPQYLCEYDGKRLYDAGENVTGWVMLRDQSAEGEAVHVDFSEALDAEGKLDIHYQQWQYFDCISDGQSKLVHPHFTWNGFRYFAITGNAVPEKVTVIHADTPKRSAFKSDHSVLNWIHDTFIHTLLCNMHGGIPSDCPHLERRGYTGDGQLTMEAALLTLNHKEFVRKWMRDIADCQDRISGHVQYTAPYTRCGGGPGGWGCAIVAVPYQYYRRYGEKSHLKEMLPGMYAYIRYLIAHSENGLVVSDRPGEWCLGDWCCPGGVQIPEPFVNNYFLIRSLDQIAQIEKAIGAETNTELKGYRETAVNALISAYFNAETGNFAGNIQGSNAFALEIGLGDERTFQNLVQHYEELGYYDTGIFGTDIVTRVLFEGGACDTAYRLLRDEKKKAFAGWMEKGATTLWEYWPEDYQRSLNHPMFGAVVSSLYKYTLGIRQEESSAGWDQVIIEPMLMHKVTSLEGHIETRHGTISVVYDTTEEYIHLDVEIPHGVEAVLRYKGSMLTLDEGMNHLVL